MRFLLPEIDGSCQGLYSSIIHGYMVLQIFMIYACIKNIRDYCERIPSSTTTFRFVVVACYPSYASINRRCLSFCDCRGLYLEESTTARHNRAVIVSLPQSPPDIISSGAASRYYVVVHSCLRNDTVVFGHTSRFPY